MMPEKRLTNPQSYGPGEVFGGPSQLVLTESLDRLSSDQEHIADIYKRAAFGGVRLATVAEGEITELHIGLKGTMGALYVKDIADKTHRGLEGHIRKGRAVGTVVYGDRVVRGPLGPDSEFERGLRAVLEAAGVSFHDADAAPGDPSTEWLTAALSSEKAGPRAHWPLVGRVREGQGPSPRALRQPPPRPR